MTTPQDTPDAMLAAEYVLRLLDETEAQAAARRVAADPAFAARVAEWEAQFSTLAEDLPPVAPPVGSRQAILDRLFPDAAPVPFWKRVFVWRSIGILAPLALLVALLFGPLNQPPVPGTGPLYTAEIVSEAGDFRVVAVVDKTADRITLTRTAGAAPPGRILQVWAHGPDAPALSVGLWPEGDVVTLPLPATIAAVEGVLTVGVSEEPPGGSPTGSPTGRVFGTVDIPGVTSPI